MKQSVENFQLCRAVSFKTCEVAASLGRGLNLGNMLDAPKEGDWGVRAEPRFINMVATDFKLVRVPVRWSNHASPDEAEVRGISWAYWEFASSFGIFDPKTNTWNSEIRRALLN